MESAPISKSARASGQIWRPEGHGVCGFQVPRSSNIRYVGDEKSYILKSSQLHSVTFRSLSNNHIPESEQSPLFHHITFVPYLVCAIFHFQLFWPRGLLFLFSIFFAASANNLVFRAAPARYPPRKSWNKKRTIEEQHSISSDFEVGTYSCSDWPARERGELTTRTEF